MPANRPFTPNGTPPSAFFSTVITSFSKSNKRFQVIDNTPTQKLGAATALPPPKSLFILDSSFNPPTVAHLHLAVSALRSPNTEVYPYPRRLLLLLSTQNADKAPKPAAFEHRVAMMMKFSSDILKELKSDDPANPKEEQMPVIDVGLTTEPYFNVKSKVIEESRYYHEKDSDGKPVGSGPTHVHLIGYDTLIRLLDTKYYPPEHSLAVLTPFLEKHRLRVHLRLGEWGERKKQDEWIKGLGAGEEGKKGFLVENGGRKEWVERMEIIEPQKGELISSSRVREEARKDGNLCGLVTESIKAYVEEKKLYDDWACVGVGEKGGIWRQ